MKGGRGFHYEEDILDDDDFEDEYEEEEQYVPLPTAPHRSPTIGDFFFPDHKLEDQGDYDGYEEEEELYDNDIYEEDEQDDEDKLDQIFTTLDKEWDYSMCDVDKMISALRELDYDVDEFISYALNGDFGPFINCGPNKQQQLQQDGEKSGKKTKGKRTQRRPPKSQSLEPMKGFNSRQHRDCGRTVDAVSQFVAQNKERYNLVVVGHVDAGKSTLMGHMLMINGSISHSKMAKLDRESSQMGKAKDKYAWVMAEDNVERERGVTIDVAMTEFETKNKTITILDAPGHREYVPSMIAGSAQADVALLVVDASNILLDKGQSREHLLICRSLGVNGLIIAVNKMDTVDYSEEKFNEIKKIYNEFLSSLSWEALLYIPTAAFEGDNLMQLSKNMSWYKGPTIYQALDEFKPPPRNFTAPFLFIVAESQDSGNKIVNVTGKIESGYVCIGDFVRVYPVNKTIRVSLIRVNGKQSSFGYAGMMVTLSLQTSVTRDAIIVSSVITPPDIVYPISNKFEARISLFDTLDSPLIKGTPLMFHRQSLDTPIRVDRIVAKVNRKTKQVEKKNPVFAPKNSTADVIFELSEIPLCLDVNKSVLNRFILRNRGKTIGFGTINNVIPV